MARRKSGFLHEGSDSEDAGASSDEEVRYGAPPAFVSSKKKAAPTFVRAEKAATPDAAEPGELHDPPSVSFVRRSMGGLGFDGGVPEPPSAPVPLSRTSGSGGFDPSAYMRQMGWTGAGLGREGEGMVNPIEVQLRPNRAGVAFGGRREKTKAERVEERRRTGAPLSSDEDEAVRKPALSSAWKRKPRERKPAVVYRTYEEIVAEATDAAPTSGPVLDATGAEVREVGSVADALAKHPVPTSDSTQLPELRHNVRLLRESSARALQKLARDGAAHLDRARFLQRDIDESARRADRIQSERAVLASALDAVAHLSEAAAVAEHLEDLSPFVERLLVLPSPVKTTLRLDEAVAGAMVPVVRTPTNSAPTCDGRLGSAGVACSVHPYPLRVAATAGGIGRGRGDDTV